MPRLISTRIKQQLLILTTIFIRIRSKKRKLSYLHGPLVVAKMGFHCVRWLFKLTLWDLQASMSSLSMQQERKVMWVALLLCNRSLLCGRRYNTTV